MAFPGRNTGGGKGGSALTLSDVLQDGCCMEDACAAGRGPAVRRLFEGCPPGRKQILLRFGLAGHRPASGNGTAAPDQQKDAARLETHALDQLRKTWLWE